MVYFADLNDGFYNSLHFLNKYYGITRNPITGDFILVMKYYKLGNLKNYITKNFYNIKWNEKLEILVHIVKGLDHLYNQEIIHRDFHSENILYENDSDVVISDLGISKSSIKSTNDDDNEMWELITGRMPFWDQNNDTELIIKICKNFRPLIIKSAPKGYVELMQEC